MRLRSHLAPLALLLALACHETAITTPPPTDRFYFPTGLAVRHEPAGCLAGTAGCRTQLLVVSTNYDLAYDPANGGTVIAVDVDQALAQAAVPGAPSPLPPPVLGVAQIGSFGGELAILDSTTCPTWNGPAQALVTSRSALALYRLDVAPTGALSCGAECTVPLDPALADPYGVTVACGSFPAGIGAAPASRAFAFVTYLRAPDVHGWLAQVDLLATDAAGTRTSPTSSIDVQIAPTGQSFFDPVSTRLYVTARFAQTGYTPLRWLELANPARTPETVDVFTTLRGADLRGMVLSTDRTRAYVAARFYDPDFAVQFGIRNTVDLAGALLVLDATALTTTLPTLRVLDVVPLDRGASEIRVLTRTNQRDLVVISSTDDSTVTLYDDETGAVAATLSYCAGAAVDATAPGPCAPGAPVLGANPFGLAVEPLAGGLARLYVGSFDRAWVNVVQIDPAHPAAAPSAWIRVGPERL